MKKLNKTIVMKLFEVLRVETKVLYDHITMYDYFVLGDMKKKDGSVRRNNVFLYTWIRRMEFK
jgi:hypothetical protein